MKTKILISPLARRILGLVFLVGCAISAPLPAADPPPEFIAGETAARSRIPLGGNFRPDPRQPAFVAVGHGGRILLSRDDGKNWRQVYFGHAGSDHGPWATKAVAYAGGVFVVPIGWGGPTSWLASEDGVNWRHLTGGQTKLKGIKHADGDPSVMPGTWGIAGGQGVDGRPVFVTGGYMTMATTPDLGKSITTFSLRSFKDDPRPRRLVTHHVGPVFCGKKSGRFLALGNDRSKADPVFGNLFASDDHGRTWDWLEPALLNKQCDGYCGIVSNGQLVLIADKRGAAAFVSSDAGESWEGPFATGTECASLSLVGKEFWLVGAKQSRASVDGRTWRDLPPGIPAGKIVASESGTLISIDRRRADIHRSSDRGKTWKQVHAFEPETEHVHGAQGLRDAAFGYTTEKPIR